MKKNLLILTLALLIALPVFSLAAEVTKPVTPQAEAAQTASETPEGQTTEAAPLGRRQNRRFSQTAPETVVRQTGFADADQDGICDNCGQEQGKNTNAPNFIDENKDGVCDHFGTDGQGQGARNIQAMRNRMHQMQGRMQEMKGRMQQMRGRMPQMQGRMQNAQGMRGPAQPTQGRGAQGKMGTAHSAQGQSTQGNVQGPNYADANNDGVCDNLGTNSQRNMAPGRNRR